MAPLPLPPPLLSMYRLVSLDESTGHKLSPARKVPSSTWGPLETALPGASCFQLRGHQAHLLPSLSGGHACSICHHGPALCKVLWSRRKSSCPCSEDYDLGGRIRWRKKKAKWVLMMAVDSGTEECSSLDFMGTSGGLCLPPEMGSSPSPEETHSLAGQLNIEKAPT